MRAHCDFCLYRGEERFLCRDCLIEQLRAELAFQKNAHEMAQQALLEQGTELSAVKQQRDELVEALGLLPSVNISEQPEWEMSENNGTIWRLFLERYCNAALAKVKS